MGNIIMVLIFAGIGFTAWETWHKYEKEKLEVLESKCIQDAVRNAELVIDQKKVIDDLIDAGNNLRKKIDEQWQRIEMLEQSKCTHDELEKWKTAYVRRGVLLDLNGITEKEG